MRFLRKERETHLLGRRPQRYGFTATAIRIGKQMEPNWKDEWKDWQKDLQKVKQKVKQKDLRKDLQKVKRKD